MVVFTQNIAQFCMSECHHLQIVWKSSFTVWVWKNEVMIYENSLDFFFFLLLSEKREAWVYFCGDLAVVLMPYLYVIFCRTKNNTARSGVLSTQTDRCEYMA